jgi:hypothetical protein
VEESYRGGPADLKLGLEPPISQSRTQELSQSVQEVTEDSPKRTQRAQKIFPKKNPDSTHFLLKIAFWILNHEF